jgi:hypothetical protein
VGGVPDKELLFFEENKVAVWNLGNLTFPAAGIYFFKFTVIGNNSGSSRYTVCIDCIKLTPQ